MSRSVAGLLALATAAYAAWTARAFDAALPMFTVFLAALLFAHAVVLLTPAFEAPVFTGPAFVAYGVLLALAQAAAGTATTISGIVLIALGLALIVVGEAVLRRTHPFAPRRRGRAI